MAAVVIGLVLLAVVMVGALLATRTAGGGLGGAGSRGMPGQYTAGPVTLTNVEVHEDSADDFEVRASARHTGAEPFDVDLVVDILDDERVIGSGDASLSFLGAERRDAVFISFDDYDADFDQVTFRLADPLAGSLAELRTVEGSFASGDFTLTDIQVGADAVDDFEVRGTVTYEGTAPVDADLAVVIDGPEGDLGRASALQTFEPGESLPIAFTTTADHVAGDLTVVPLPGDRAVGGVTFTSIRLVRYYAGDVAVDAVAVASDAGSAYDGEIQAQVLRAGEVVATVTGYATLAPGQATTVYLSGTDDFAEPIDDVRFTLFRR